jgi:hypothetical protein
MVLKSLWQEKYPINEDFMYGPFDIDKYKDKHTLIKDKLLSLSKEKRNSTDFVGFVNILLKEEPFNIMIEARMKGEFITFVNKYASILPFINNDYHLIDLWNDFKSANTPKKSTFNLYPFRSKVSVYAKLHDIDKPDTRIVDPKIKPIMRPYYSKHIGAWEIDLMDKSKDIESIVFIAIGINNKYLFTQFIQSKSSADLINASYNLYKHVPSLKSIRSDSESAILSEDYKRFCKSLNILTFESKSDFTNHNRVVDSVIRTIRNSHDKMPITRQSLSEFTEYYNNTPHKAFNNLITPKEMLLDNELEQRYIQLMDKRLEEINYLQRKEQLLSYRKGNILMIHIQPNRIKMIKVRRRFEYLAEFIQYSHGNAVCRLLRPIYVGKNKVYKIIEIPVWHTKYLCESLENLQFFNTIMKVDNEI